MYLSPTPWYFPHQRDAITALWVSQHILLVTSLLCWHCIWCGVLLLDITLFRAVRQVFCCSIHNTSFSLNCLHLSARPPFEARIDIDRGAPHSTSSIHQSSIQCTTKEHSEQRGNLFAHDPVIEALNAGAAAVEARGECTANWRE
jgi:hypothetical protein